MENKSILNFTLDDHLSVLSKNTSNYTTVYRIESPSSQLGPFSFDRNFEIGKYSHQLSPNKDPGFYQGYIPHLREDDMFEGSYQWFLFFQDRVKDSGDFINFAFFSLENLLQWFSKEELMRFHQAGLVLSVIQVQRSWASDTQAIFLKSEIISCENKSLQEVFNLDN